jgi:hypothetical protein
MKIDEYNTEAVKNFTESFRLKYYLSFKKSLSVSITWQETVTKLVRLITKNTVDLQITPFL